ncbi:GEM-like protein 1 isoform X2 [Diospyros lotus]|uniref:GEM-like protein 1 isoform X2 n=1 Tax=Diospyros lotus TaxID=55363 RepID=UPI002252B1AB|nr:GEM-like protein 1 isoform X2 [Diospyros lotus]
MRVCLRERASERSRERERELEDRGSLMATKYDDYDDEYLTRPYEDDDDELLRQLRGSNTTAAVTPERISSVSEPATVCHSPSSSSSSLSPSRSSVEDPVGGGGVGGGKKKKKKQQLGRKSHSFAYRIREHCTDIENGAQVIGNGEREVESGGDNPSEGREGEHIQARVRDEAGGGGEAAQGLSVLPLHDSRPHRRHPLHLHIQDRLLQRKVSIPIEKIKRAGESENANKPEDKYVEIVTEDGFEFWFMGFVRYEKAITNLHKAVSGAGTG